MDLELRHFVAKSTGTTQSRHFIIEVYPSMHGRYFCPQMMCLTGVDIFVLHAQQHRKRLDGIQLAGRLATQDSFAKQVQIRPSIHLPFNQF